MTSPKPTLEERGHLILQLIIHHQRHEPRRELKQRPCRMLLDEFLPMVCSSCLLISLRTTCSGVAPPSIINQETCLQANLIELIPELRFVLPRYVLACVKLTETTSIPWHYLIRGFSIFWGIPLVVHGNHLVCHASSLRLSCCGLGKSYHTWKSPVNATMTSCVM